MGAAAARRRRFVPWPSYPIHIWGPYFAGADARQVAVGTGEDYVGNVMEAWEYGWPSRGSSCCRSRTTRRPRRVELADMQRLVDWARERDVVLVHDFAYADAAFDGWLPPSILQCEGGKECAVELYSMTKSFSMAGWRVAYLVGNAEVVRALAKLKSYLDYGTFQPIQIAATVTLNEAQRLSQAGQRDLPVAADALCDGLERSAGRSRGPAARCSRGRRSRALRRTRLDRVRQAGRHECDVALSPGVGFGSGRRVRAVRAHRERAAHPAGGPPAQARPAQARLTPGPAAELT